MRMSLFAHQNQQKCQISNKIHRHDVLRSIATKKLAISEEPLFVLSTVIITIFTVIVMETCMEVAQARLAQEVTIVIPQ